MVSSYYYLDHQNCCSSCAFLRPFTKDPWKRICPAVNTGTQVCRTGFKPCYSISFDKSPASLPFSSLRYISGYPVTHCWEGSPVIDSHLIKGGGGVAIHYLVLHVTETVWSSGYVGLLDLCTGALRPLETNIGEGEGGEGVISVRIQRLRVSYVLQIVLTNYIRYWSVNFSPNSGES